MVVMYLPTALFLPIMPRNGTGQRVCWGRRTGTCVVLGPKPQAELWRGRPQGHVPSVKSSGYTGNLRAMSSRMPFPIGRKSFCFGGWAGGQMSVSREAHAAGHLPTPASPLYLQGSAYADGVHEAL